jgi:hypothetical protein
MSEPRQNHIGLWLAGLLIGLPVLYVASFGPACWWFSKEATPEFSLRRADVIDVPRSLAPQAPQAYWPLGWLAANGPRPITRMLFWYATAGGQQLVHLPCDEHGRSWIYPP